MLGLRPGTLASGSEMSAMLVLIVIAFIAGLVTAVSPCVLPILPIVLAAGSGGDRRRPYLIITGLIASFAFFTLAATQIIRSLGLPDSALRDAAIVVIAVFGLTLLVPALSNAWDRASARLPAAGARLARKGVPGGLITGVGLGLVWTPCAGPILGAITALSATAPVSGATVMLVAAYSIGAGLPLLAIALGGRSVLTRLRLRAASRWAPRALGALVLVSALAMAAGLDTAISADLTSALPDWTGTLQTLERAAPVQAALHDLGAGNAQAGIGSGVGDLAPDFTGIDHWLNSGPLTMAGLRGKVVLVDFWTYSCINCIRTLPYLESWYQKYSSAGLVVVGIHTPEFAFEHDTANVAAAISRFGLTYPVAQDNEYATWGAYANEYWPAHYLIDATGHIVSVHFGEGDYAGTENDIRSLLAGVDATALPTVVGSEGPQPFVAGETGETYLGTDRASAYAFVPQSGVADYSFPTSLSDDRYALSGRFDLQPQYINTDAAGAALELSFYARDVYLVLASDNPTSATVSVSGAEAISTEDVGAGRIMSIGPARLYHLVHLAVPTRATLTITFSKPGIRAYAFTFGGA